MVLRFVSFPLSSHHFDPWIHSVSLIKWGLSISRTQHLSLNIFFKINFLTNLKQLDIWLYKLIITMFSFYCILNWLWKSGITLGNKRLFWVGNFALHNLLKSSWDGEYIIPDTGIGLWQTFNNILLMYVSQFTFTNP